MVNYAALKAEISQLAYKGMSDDEIVAALNVKQIEVDQLIPVNQVKQFFIRQGILANVTLFAEDVANERQMRALCITVRDAILNDVFPNFDLNDKAARAEIDAFCEGLIAAQCMTAEQQTALYSFGKTFVPWAEISVGIPVISQPDLENAKVAE